MATTASPLATDARVWPPPASVHQETATANRRRQPNDAGVAISVVTLVLLVGGFLAYMVLKVPVLAPRLPRSAALRHWTIAVVAAVAVVLVDIGVIAASYRRRSRLSMDPAPVNEREAGTPAGPEDALRAVTSRRRAPSRVVLTTAGASGLLFGTALAADYPLWVLGSAVLIPWLPIVSLEVFWAAQREPIYAFFAAVVGFQVLHMGEHSAQVAQLALTNGDLARSHGVFGQLDFELVHFVSDIAVWLALGAVIICLRHTRSPWLWIAFGAASAHAIEHLYLWWIYSEFRGFYTIGGFAGIMGAHGVIGSPLGRPYMHFAYNFVVVLPMVLALWDQRRKSRGRVPRSREIALAS